MLTVVTTPTCPWCVKVKGLLRMHNIAFEEWQPETTILREVLIPRGIKTVPQVFLGDPSDPNAQRIGGYEATLKWISEKN